MQPIPGIGPILAAVFVAEIGDVTRFDRPEQLACWAGLTPTQQGCRYADSRLFTIRGVVGV